MHYHEHPVYFAHESEAMSYRQQHYADDGCPNPYFSQPPGDGCVANVE